MGLVDELAGLGGLARDGDEALLVDPVFVQQIRDHGGHQHQQCQHGALPHVIAAGDDLIDLHGQGGEVAADGGGVGEVLQRLDEHQQAAGDDARQGQREGDRPEGVPPAGAHVAGGVLHRRVDRGEDAGERHVGDGEEAQHLHHNQAAHAVYVVALDPQQGFCNQALPAEQEDDGQAQDERRRQDGQGGDGLQKALAGDVGAGDGIGEDVPDKGGDHRHDQAQSHGAAERLQIPGGGEDLRRSGQGEGAGLVGQAEEQDLDQGIDHEQKQKCDDRDHGEQHHRLAHDHLGLVPLFQAGSAFAAGAGRVCHLGSSC